MFIRSILSIVLISISVGAAFIYTRTAIGLPIERPEDRQQKYSSSFGVKVRASDMQCNLYVNDTLVVSTDQYSDHPFLMTFYMPMENNILMEGDNTLRVEAIELLDKRGESPNDWYCELELLGSTEELATQKTVFDQSAPFMIRFNDAHEPLIDDPHTKKVSVQKNDELAIITVEQQYPISVLEESRWATSETMTDTPQNRQEILQFYRELRHTMQHGSQYEILKILNPLSSELSYRYKQRPRDGAAYFLEVTGMNDLNKMYLETPPLKPNDYDLVLLQNGKLFKMILKEGKEGSDTPLYWLSGNTFYSFPVLLTKQNGQIKVAALK